jgi:16S rRNA (guanine966-N2)-methyltransferase
MRIIGGQFKGRNIVAPGNLPVRPTTDFAKEGLFNILSNRINFEETNFLDLFCGTGNISWEMASRGCQRITCVDENFNCYAFITKMADKLGLKTMKAFRSDAFKFCNTSLEKFDLIFADPPFNHEKTASLPDLIFEKDLLNIEGILIIEHPKDFNFNNHPNFKEERKYGKIHFSFFGK